MKKLLYILSILALFTPGSVFAFPATFNSTSSNAFFIQPNPINGNNPNLNILGVGTSTFLGNLSVVGNLQGARIIAPVVFSTSTVAITGSGNCLTVDSPTMTVDCTNHEVGIGTTVPSDKLSIFAPNSTLSGIAIYGTDNSSKKYAQLYTTANQGSLNLYDSDGSTVRVRIVGGSAVATYFNGGNVGVGTTSPRTLFTVENNGTVPIFLSDDSQTTGNKGFLIRNNINELQLLPATDIGAGQTTGINIDRNANLGIGTTTPQALISLVDGTTAAGGIKFGSDVSLYRSTTGVLTLNTSGTDRITFGTGSTITSASGNDLTLKAGTTNQNIILTPSGTGGTGISTSTPFARLSVSQSSSLITPFIDIASTTGAINQSVFRIDSSGHRTSSTTAPTLSSGTVDGTDQKGRVTGASSGVVITFNQAFPRTPSCIVTPESGSITNTFSYTPTATTLTVTEVGLGTFDYSCGIGAD